MRNDNLDFIVVNGRRYAIDLLNPLDAITWGSRATTLFAPLLAAGMGTVKKDMVLLLMTGGAEPDEETDRPGGNIAELWDMLAPALSSMLTACGKIASESAAGMITESLQRCYTPQNEPLSNMDVLNRHFRTYPEDLYQLGTLALIRLVRDFFPNLPGIGTILSQYRER